MLRKRGQWILTAALLALVLMLAAGCAAAEGKTNPRRAHVEETLRWIQEAEDQDSRIRAGTPAVMLSCTKTPTLSARGSFSASVLNDDGSDWRFEYAVQDMGRDSGGYVYFGDPVESRTFSSLTFYTGGNYRIWVFLYRNGSSTRVSCDTVDFKVADDSSHPTLEQKMAQIVSECRGASQWETALNLHDWLTHHLYYDLNYEYYGADAVFRGKGVCDAYSKAYKMLCDTAGITVERVTNHSMGHAWNAVKLGGEWYQTDVTWDDPAGGTEAVSGWESYDYFCLNDELMFTDHESSGVSFRPGCTSLEANYYIHTGQWEQFTVYNWSGNRVMDVLLARIRAGETSPSIPTAGSSASAWIYYVNGNTGWRMDEIKYRLSVYGMNHAKWTLADGTVLKVQVEYDPQGQTVTARVLESIWGPDALVFPAGTRVIGAEALRGTVAVKAVLPEGCTEIGDFAFADSGVKTVIIPASLTVIGEHAFDGCESIVFVLQGENSAAEAYAAAHGYSVEH